MARPDATAKTAEEMRALQIATATLKSAQLTARASKARLQALKGEVKIQKQHYKWARKQVRVAKDTLAEWRTAAAAMAVAGTEPPAPAPAAKRARAPASVGRKGQAASAKPGALAIKRLVLRPVAPVPAPSAVPAQSAKNLPSQPAAARREPASAPDATTPQAD